MEETGPASSASWDGPLYWADILLALIGNGLIMAGLLPLVLRAPQPLTLAVASLIGLCFGLLINFLFSSIGLSQPAYYYASLLIPTLSAAAMLWVFTVAKGALARLSIDLPGNPLLLVAVYIISFMAPYLLARLREARPWT